MLHAARSSRSVRRSLTSFRFPAARQAVPTSARSWISTKSMNQIPPAEHGSTGYMRFSSPSVKISACQSPVPPFPTALIYNQSKHACQSVLADLRAVWGSKIHVIQTVEAGQHALQVSPLFRQPLFCPSSFHGCLSVAVCRGGHLNLGRHPTGFLGRLQLPTF